MQQNKPVPWYDAADAAIKEASIPRSDLVVRQRPECRTRFRIIDKRKQKLVKEVDISSRSSGASSFDDFEISRDGKYLVFYSTYGHCLKDYNFITVINNKIQVLWAGELIRDKCFYTDYYDKKTRKPLLYQGAPDLLGIFKNEWAVFYQAYKLPRTAEITQCKYLLLSLKTHKTLMLDDLDTRRVIKLEKLKWKGYDRERWHYLE